MTSTQSRAALLIHVGLPKTASTWLQHTAFSVPGGQMFSPWGAPSGAAVDHFISVNPFTFSAEETRRIFEPGLDQGRDTGRVPVLSQEMLGGDHVAGRYWGKEVACRLREVFPEARVLLMIREQQSMILSAFGQYIRNGGEGDLTKFIGGREQRPGFSPVCQLSFLQYHREIDHYQRLFGKDNLLVLPFELLRKDRSAALAELANFVGCSSLGGQDAGTANVNYGAATLELHRRLNRHLPSPDYSSSNHPIVWRAAWKGLRWLDDELIPKSFQKRRQQEWARLIAERTQGLYAESNRACFELTGRDLGSFGYEV